MPLGSRVLLLLWVPLLPQVSRVQLLSPVATLMGCALAMGVRSSAVVLSATGVSGAADLIDTTVVSGALMPWVLL